MSKTELSEMSDEALLKHAELMQKSKLYDTFIMGFLIGIAIYSSVKNGFGLLTFLPLLYPPVAAKNSVQRKAVAALMRQRGLRLKSG